MEDSFTFSPPSSPSSYCSPPVASPRDVYHDLELEEFGTEELVDSDNYKTGSRLDLNLELQVLVAENRQLHRKLEATQAEKADAIQMWRKQREENKKLKMQLIELEAQLVVLTPNLNPKCQVSDFGRAALQMLESSRNARSNSVPGEESPLNLQKRKRATTLKSPATKPQPATPSRKGPPPLRTPSPHKMQSITNNGLRSKRWIAMQKKIETHKMQEEIRDAKGKAKASKHDVKGKEREKEKEKEKEREDEEEPTRSLKKRRVADQVLKKEAIALLQPQDLAQGTRPRDDVASEVVEIDDVLCLKKKKEKGETGPKEYPCRDCRRVFCRRGDRDNHERLVGHTKWSKGRSFNLGFVQT